MRWLVVSIIVMLPVIAMAKPGVAVAPLDGDDGNKIASIVVKVLAADGMAVVGPKDTAKAMKKLGLAGKLSKPEQKKLRKKLGVDVLVQGQVEEKAVELRVAGRGVTTSRFAVKFKSAKSPNLEDDLREALGKRLAPGESDDDDAEDDKPARVAERDDEDSEPKKKRKKRRDDDEPTTRHPVTQAAVRANIGAAFARRGLTYASTGGAAPPSVGTAAPSARFELEAYPAAMDTLTGFVAGLGVYGHFDRALLLSIDIGGKSAPITYQHYSIGARYRVVFGQSAVAFGVGYAARSYVADRSGLGMTKLDMPDTRYSAIAPNVVASFPASPTIGLFVGGAFELMLGAGQITKDFGYARTIAFDASAGADIALAKRYGVRLAAELNQVGLSFRTPQRGVSSATDRTIGVTASFEVLY